MGLFYPPDSTGENKANAPVSGNTGATYNAVTLLFSFCAFTYHGNTGQHFGDRQPQQKPREKIFDIGAAQGMRQGLKSSAHDDKNNAGFTGKMIPTVRRIWVEKCIFVVSMLVSVCLPALVCRFWTDHCKAGLGFLPHG